MNDFLANMTFKIPIGYGDGQTIVENKKKCSICKCFKDFSCFVPDKRKSTGLQSSCKECQNKKSAIVRKTIYSINVRKVYRVKFRKLVINHYLNGFNICNCCGESVYEFLSIDHIEGGGAKHMKFVNRFGWGFYKWLVDNNYPAGYQVLCYNCNFAKGKYGMCSHKSKLFEEKK